MSREDEIRERCKKATRGPWVYNYNGGEPTVDAPSLPVGQQNLCAQAFAEDDDFYFIAHAREDIPWLLDKLASMRKELVVAREECAESRAKAFEDAAAYMDSLSGVDHEYGDHPGYFREEAAKARGQKP